MFRIQIICYTVISAYFVTELSAIQTTTLSVRQRVAILQRQIETELRAKGGKNMPVEEHSSFEETEYDHDRLYLTPINEKKKKSKWTTVKMTSSNVRNGAIFPAANTTPSAEAVRSKKKKFIVKNISDEFNIFTLRKPKETFYRRLIDEYKMNTEVQWVHCQDMITPFLQGFKKDLSFQSHLNSKSPTVRRFIHLLTLNTTSFTKEDIYSVLYQISKLQLRLYQWDLSAINLLFNILMKEKKHTFSNLKRAVRTHFEEWRLDISNVTNLLRQTRIFRPPCVRISDSTGSTISNKVTGYPKNIPRKPGCDDTEDGDCKYN